jgi:hypothetical protein
MTKKEAIETADRINANDDIGYTASVVRVLPETIDPPNADDNGWDVEIRMK